MPTNPLHRILEMSRSHPFIATEISCVLRKPLRVLVSEPAFTMILSCCSKRLNYPGESSFALYVSRTSLGPYNVLNLGQRGPASDDVNSHIVRQWSKLTTTDLPEAITVLPTPITHWHFVEAYSQPRYFASVIIVIMNHTCEPLS